MGKVKGITAPKYMPADILRKLTVEQLRILMTQLNTRGITSENGRRAQKILWQSGGHTSVNTGVTCPLTMVERGWTIPTEKTIDLSAWLNGTELIEGRESWL